MSSKSSNVDQTTANTTTAVLDRRVTQERGLQILDSVMVSNDDAVVKAALGEVRAMLMNMGNQNSVTTARLEKALSTVLQFVGKGQVEMSSFALAALEKARSELRDISDKGQAVIQLSAETTRGALSMAERLAQSQAINQNEALDILAETKTGDYADLTKSLTLMMMLFILGATMITRKG